MAKLIATTPCAGLLPKTIGNVTFAELDVGNVTLIAPFKDCTNRTSSALKAALNVTFPQPNRTSGVDPRIVWYGRDQALLIGATCPELPAQCIDQTDSIALVEASGDDVEAVLARLVPIDLRLSAFEIGHTARTMLAHMNVSIIRTGKTRFEVMAMRSMAATLVHDLTQAAIGVAGRQTHLL